MRMRLCQTLGFAKHSAYVAPTYLPHAPTVPLRIPSCVHHHHTHYPHALLLALLLAMPPADAAHHDQVRLRRRRDRRSGSASHDGGDCPPPCRGARCGGLSSLLPLHPPSALNLATGLAATLLSHPGDVTSDAEPCRRAHNVPPPPPAVVRLRRHNYRHSRYSTGTSPQRCRCRTNPRRTHRHTPPPPPDTADMLLHGLVVHAADARKRGAQPV